ncbi:MAG: hypothetical protein KJ674_04010 [Nanoarchaeota archaeon]|nr:hypothetical protein [Nanoarchaeota archaeon]
MLDECISYKGTACLGDYCCAPTSRFPCVYQTPVEPDLGYSCKITGDLERIAKDGKINPSKIILETHPTSTIHS